MNEASKTRRLWTRLETDILQGRGIDIGCGPDPVTPDARRFDREHGDANVISRHVSDTYDFVFSAHCLEHMVDARAAILEWWTLVKPGGHLFVIVPDEELYEQGIWPSIFNPDHKATFTMSQGGRHSPVSINVLDLASTIPDSEVVDIRLHDAHYDRRYLRDGSRDPRAWAVAVRRVRWSLLRVLRSLGINARLNWFATVFRVPVDQTLGDASAQIQMIVRRRSIAP